MSRNRGSWTAAKTEYLAKVQAVLDDLREYLPVTLRQVYYQLVAAGEIENDKGQYNKLSRVLTQARLDGIVPWEAIEDRTRATLRSGGWSSQGDFIDDELRHFLDDYRRDLLQGQGTALELWVEKDALSRLCHDVAYEYCVPVVVARGFSSVSYVHECAKRVRANANAGQGTVLLYLGDLDPSGYAMLPAMMETLQNEIGVGELVEGVRCALTPEQIEEYELPHSPDALKWTDRRAPGYVEQFGELAVELDALRPNVLQQLVRESIEAHLDLSQLSSERQRQADERTRLKELRSTVLELVADERDDL